MTRRDSEADDAVQREWIRSVTNTVERGGVT